MSQYLENAKLFKAFCDESRLKIIEQLKGGERCACHLLDALPISQSTLSHHMKILVESGVVAGRKEGKWVHYALSKDGMKKAYDFLDALDNKSEGTRDQCACQ